MSSQQKALFIMKPASLDWKLATRPIPKPGAGELLVKLHAVALNPCDWGIPAMGLVGNGFPEASEYPCILGKDLAGTVEEIGEGVTGFKEGDRIIHVARFGNDTTCFQQYTIAKAVDLVAKIPSNVSFEDAASLPLCLATAAIGLYADRDSEDAPKYTPPWVDGGLDKYKNEPIVIFGGSSSVAIQLAKLSGFSPIITTASPRNFDLCRSVGATHVLDRSSSSLVNDVAVALNHRPVKLVYDTVCFGGSQIMAWEVVVDGGILIHHPGRPVDTAKYPTKFTYQPLANFFLSQYRVLGVGLYAKLSEWLGQGLIKPNPVEVLPGGLGGIEDGLKLLQAFKVSGKKLVVRPVDE